MTVEAHKETLEFQTEVRQLLNLMINSLYSNKEIFLRELISNASDAADKLRFEALTDDALFEGEGELAIEVEYDKKKRTVTVRDNGIGMSRQEVIDNIGTIAKSGTKQFFDALTGDQAKDSQLIGQFGVGFYSAFIVADKVTLTTRRAGLSAEHGVRWISNGEGEFELETVERKQRGTEVVLHLRKGEKELLDGFGLRSIIRRYSDHIQLPIKMYSESEEQKGEWETVNQASALWARNKSEISEDEYKAFYKHVGHDFEDPMTWLHNRVEGTNEYATLFYIPKRAPFDLWDRDRRHGIKLYVKRVFILDDAEHLMPNYLRFVRGVVDSSSLPLNISREILQHNSTIEKIRNGSVKKILGHLERIAKKDQETYQEFWEQFGRVMKEGPAEDFANRERIAKLLRFATTHDDDAQQTHSLDDYIGRMPEDQEKIYYITAETHAAAKSSPHLEVFRKKGIEVLLLSDRVDEWLTSSLTEYDGKQLQSVAKGELNLGKLEDEKDKQAQEEANKAHKSFVEKLQQKLEDKVREVRLTQRLTESPACLVSGEHDMSGNLERILKSAGQEVPNSKPDLELNADHPMVAHIEADADGPRFDDFAQLLYEQALLSEGGQLEDPASFVKRMNQIMLELAQSSAA